MAEGRTEFGTAGAAPPGRSASSWLLLAGAAGLLVMAAVHLTGYAVATIAVRNSGLTPLFQGYFRALWLGYSLQFAVIAAILATAGLRPGSVSKAVTILCGLLPLPSGVLLAQSSGNLFATVSFLAVALLIVAGALLSPGIPRPAALAAGSPPKDAPRP